MNYMQSSSYDLTARTAAQGSFMTRVYGWMAAGLGITALVAAFTANSPVLMPMVRSLYLPLVIVELILVFSLSAFVARMPAALANLLFLAYSALNGLTLSAIFLVYTNSSIASAFVVSAGMFGAMALFGTATKRDLTGLGSFMFMGLIGLVLASLVNIFLHSPMIYWLTTYFGVFIFVGLTAYDAQKIKQMAHSGIGGDEARRASVVGALALYLDFINLFLFVLRIFGGRRNSY